jgi:hypothetical protein
MGRFRKKCLRSLGGRIFRQSGYRNQHRAQNDQKKQFSQQKTISFLLWAEPILKRLF